MAFYQTSTLSVSAAIDQITDTAGASANTDERTRALRSLGAAFKHWNVMGRKGSWTFLETEANPIAVRGPFTVTAVTVSGAGVSATAGAGHGFEPDDILVGYGMRVGTRIATTASTTLTLNTAATGFTGTATADLAVTRDLYDFPTDFAKPYTARLLVSQRTLSFLRRRRWDRVVTDEFLNSTVYWYNVFHVGQKGKIQLLPPVDSDDTLLVRYYRRMTVPTATAGNLDIPQDYDDYLVSWAKWHYLTDKGDGRREQATTWLGIAQNGLESIKQDNAIQPDEMLTFTPGAYSDNLGIGPNSRRFVDESRR